ncbi:MAG: hypothetical protein V7785_21475 [Bermanella sp.]
MKYMNVVLLGVSIGLAGCAGSKVKPPLKPVKKTYEIVQYNPIIGEVSSEHPEYLKAKSECEGEVYKDGVEAKGMVMKNRNELNEISSEHMSEYIKNRLYKDLDISGAYHGASAAISVSSGNLQSTYTSKNKSKSYAGYMQEYMTLPKPKEIAAIESLQKEYISCMRNEKQFKPIKTIVKNAETGEVISVFETK